MRAQFADRSSLFWVVIAGAAAFSMSTLFSSMKPILVARFAQEVGFSSAVNGLIAAMPFVGIAVASVLVNRLLGQFSYRTIVMLCGVLLLAAELLNSLLFSYLIWVLPLQFIAGVSVGLLMGITANAIATSAYPNQLFGIVDMIGVMLMSLMVFGAGMAVETDGLHGGFRFAAWVSLLFTLLMLPHKPAQERAQAGANNQPEMALLPLLVITMGVLFVTFSGLGFTYMFSKALSLGLDYERAGQYIGIILFLSAFGCPVGGVVSARVGVQAPLFGAFFVCAVGWFMALNANSPEAFLLWLMPAVFALQFNFPILLSMSGQQDQDGKWAAVATPIITSGFAWAAVSAGVIYQLGGLNLLALATPFGMLVCALLLLMIHRLQRSSGAGS